MPTIAIAIIIAITPAKTVVTTVLLTASMVTGTVVAVGDAPGALITFAYVCAHELP